MAAVTIADVARELGVSKALVSLALNDRPGVAAATRVRVRETAAAMGWTPSPYARGLSLRATFALGLVVRRDPSVLAADPFFPSFIAGAESELSAQGWSLLLSVVGDDDAERAAYRKLAGARVDGFFLTDLRIEDQRLPLLTELQAHGVIIGPPQEGSDLPSVNVDDRAGVAGAVAHLAELGHTRIAYVTGDLQMVHGHRRRQAFREAAQAAGLNPDLIVTGDFSAASGLAATEHLMSLSERPTAIVYASDPMAVAGLSLLQSRGVKVPEEVSVIGFDGIELGRYLHPALTTIVTDPFRWGAEAVRVLRARLAGGVQAGEPAVSVELPGAELLVRNSTGRVPQA